MGARTVALPVLRWDLFASGARSRVARGPSPPRPGAGSDYQDPNTDDSNCENSPVGCFRSLQSRGSSEPGEMLARGERVRGGLGLLRLQRRSVTLCVALLAAIWCVSVASAQQVDPDRARIESAIGHVFPALVRIHVVSTMYVGGQEINVEEVGSGAIITSDGDVITNHHVVGRARRIIVRLADRQEVDATLVGTDPLSDIAVIKLDMSEVKGKLTPARFGDSDKVRVGERVLAMGCPVALSQSVTFGIVSNTQLIFPQFLWPATFKLDGEDVGSLVKWIGHDAPIHPGNSGGPLVDLNGRIIGINEIELGLSGAIPSNLARDVAFQLIRDGHVTRSWLGMTCQPMVTASRSGALIAEVVPQSPAARAGLLPGDILEKLDGHAVTVQYAEDLQALNRRMFGLRIGVPCELEAMRGGHLLKFRVTPVERQPATGKEREVRRWGMTIREITGPLARELQRADDRGVYVEGVMPAGPAGSAHPPLQPGDVIHAIDGHPVGGIAQFSNIAAPKHGEKRILVAFDRRASHMLTVVRLGDDQAPEHVREARKAWAPIRWEVLTPDLATALGVKGTRGIIVTRTLDRKARGLRSGTIITRIDGSAIQASQPEDSEVFSEMIRGYRIGSTVKLTVLEPPHYHPQEVSLKLGEQPVDEEDLRHYRDEAFGFTVREPGRIDHVRDPYAPRGGVHVVEVQPGGWAALAHVAVGDVLLGVNGKPIAGIDAFAQTMRGLAQIHARRVVFFVQRGSHTMFVQLQPAWSASTARGTGGTRAGRP